MHNFLSCVDFITYVILLSGNYDDDDQEEVEDLTKSAGLLYGMIHARYIITSAGLSVMVSE